MTLESSGESYCSVRHAILVTLRGGITHIASSAVLVMYTHNSSTFEPLESSQRLFARAYIEDTGQSLATREIWDCAVIVAPHVRSSYYSVR
jgi:hypothetical protein